MFCVLIFGTLKSKVECHQSIARFHHYLHKIFVGKILLDGGGGGGCQRCGAHDSAAKKKSARYSTVRI